MTAGVESESYNERVDDGDHSDSVLIDDSEIEDDIQEGQSDNDDDHNDNEDHHEHDNVDHKKHNENDDTHGNEDLIQDHDDDNDMPSKLDSEAELNVGDAKNAVKSSTGEIVLSPADSGKGCFYCTNYKNVSL